jgi:predicted RNA-binding Zn-ribbon protein involved in translation (DUF1610 family)
VTTGEPGTTGTYPCTACGGQMVFDIEHQKLRCPSCGNTQDIAAPRGSGDVENDLRATLAGLAAERTTEPQQLGDKEVVCRSCGGRTTFTGTLTSTRCPYCATPVQRDDVHDAPDRLPVDGVVPFAVDEDTARAAVEHWINRRRFAPREFKKYKQTGAFTSVYAAYFTYDAEADTRYVGERGEHYTVTVGSGKNQRTETRTRWYGAAGRVQNQFDDVCVLANEGFDSGRIQALEPWPTAEAAAFATEYLAGHLARTYDRDVEQCFVDARAQMEDVIDDSVRRDIGGDVQRVHQKDTSWSSLTFRHLLMPIWLLTVIYAGKPFQVFVNGTTGETQGQRPYSTAKIAAAVIAAAIVLIILLLAFT